MRVAVLAALLLSTPALAGWMEDCGLQPPGSVPTPPVPTKAWEPDARAPPSIVRRELPEVHRLHGFPTAHRLATGSLAGKVVYLSPGHGFTWDTTFTAWRTQRVAAHQIVEDLVSAETLTQFLIPMLLNAGAHVVPVRETDLNRAEVIVDNDGAGYVETGAGFSTSSLPGWGRPTTATIDGSTNPFGLGTNRLMNASATATASATFTATLPADGYYNVSISYSAFSARAPDAHVIVHHAGGETHFRVNQQRHGGTWELLGRFSFQAAVPARVVVPNDVSAGTGNVSLDAVRFGGGMGVIDRGSGTSGRPRFEESARYQAQLAGAPASVYAPSNNSPSNDRTNDVGTRPRLAAWVHETGEDAVYFAWHTNGFDGSITGTETYVYGTNPPDGTLNFAGVAGSLELANAVHGEFINDVRASAGWNRSSWVDRRIRSAYFGELNPSNNGEMPSILMEVAFHDSAVDAASIKEPAFRYLASRAITQGIIKYFAAKDGVAVRLPPEPPTQLSAVSSSDTSALVRWAAPAVDAQGVSGDAATSYRVYSSADGLGWDEGVAATSTQATVSITPSAPRFFRVTAVNAGGESFPSAIVGVRAPPAGTRKVLVVNAYDRLEAGLGQLEQFPSTYALGTVLRIFLLRMNDGSYVRLHGDALSALDVGFDSATVDAVNAGAVSPGAYALISWFAGRGHAAGGPPTAAEQNVIRGSINGGAPVLFSGAAALSASFLADPLAAATAFGAASRSVAGEGPLAGLTMVLDDGTGGTYDTGAPDVVSPLGSAVLLGSYGAGVGAGTGVAGRSAYLAFPFETIRTRATRIEVMRRLIDFLAPAGVDAGFPDAGPEPDAGVDAGDAGGDDGGAAVADGGADGGSEPPDGGARDVIAFQGGGCSALPIAPVLLAALALALRRRR